MISEMLLCSHTSHLVNTRSLLKTCCTLRRSSSWASRVVQTGDVVMLRQRTHNYDAKSKFILSPPLMRDTHVKLRYGRHMKGENIIGVAPRTTLEDSSKKGWLVLEASLATYTIHTPRLVTPLYPKSAAAIVSLLDLHLPCPGEDQLFDSSPPYEILEVGTGHGALTLHLARAIHGANPPVPAGLRKALQRTRYASSKSAPYWTSKRMNLEEQEKERYRMITDTSCNMDELVTDIPREEADIDGKENEETDTSPDEDREVSYEQDTDTPSEPHSSESDPEQLFSENLLSFRGSSKPKRPPKVQLRPEDPAHQVALDDNLQAQLDAFRASRRVILHSFDINAHFQRHAHGIVRDYKRALYLPCIDFHLGDTWIYLRDRLEKNRGQPFLYHCILDIPDPIRAGLAEEICQAVHHGGLILVYSPSITQLTECLRYIQAQNTPLVLERVVELSVETPGSGGTTGDADLGAGRDWEVRMTTVKNTGEKVMICRPKIGNMISAGGFVGCFRKVKGRPADSVVG